MKIRTLLLVALALLCGGSAAVGVNQLRRQGATSAAVDSVSVVMVAKNMPRGSVLSESVVKLQQWPKEMVPSGAIFKIEDVVDRSVLVPLVAGEPVLVGKLASKDAGRGLAAMITPGMRAFTIRTPHVAAGIGGFIMPGNKVDVLLTTSSSGRDDTTGGGATTTLLQNVQVLAVAQLLDAPDTNTVDPKELKSVTLLVKPDQAAKLDLGMNKGILHLSLRNPEDDEEADTRPATMAQLRFHQEKPLQDALTMVANLVNPADNSADSKPVTPVVHRTMQIQTLRGVQRGTIIVERN